MTLDEAIKHCEEKANENKAEATKIAREKKPFLEYARCKQCANDHEQLASWLKELKAYKERPQGEWIEKYEKILQIVEHWNDKSSSFVSACEAFEKILDVTKGGAV